MALISSHHTNLAAATTKFLIDNSITDNPANRQACSRDLLAKNVKICRLVRCWDPEKMRLELNCRPDSQEFQVMQCILEMAILHLGGIKKEGQAPRGRLERGISRGLEAHKKGKGGDLAADGLENILDQSPE